MLLLLVLLLLLFVLLLLLFGLLLLDGPANALAYVCVGVFLCVAGPAYCCCWELLLHAVPVHWCCFCSSSSYSFWRHDLLSKIFRDADSTARYEAGERSLRRHELRQLRVYRVCKDEFTFVVFR